MVSLPIDFVSHAKIPVSLRSETSETGGSVSLFHEKKFCYVLLQFRFEAKFGDTLLSPQLTKRAKEGFALFCKKKLYRFARKTKERIPIPVLYSLQYCLRFTVWHNDPTTLDGPHGSRDCPTDGPAGPGSRTG